MNSRAAAAGVAAALVWAAAEPLDQRIFRSDYSDIALLGKAVSGRHWRPIGLAMHALNGAAFGLAFDLVRRRTDAKAVTYEIAKGLRAICVPLLEDEAVETRQQISVHRNAGPG